jgi:hypothetical protein
VALDLMPWAVGGGAAHPVELARLQLFVSTGGNEGVASPGSLRVDALATPGGSVRVAPGGAVLLNRYAGGGEQSYALRNKTETVLPVASTTSAGGRSDLVVARVLDPQYEGSAPPDPNVFEYSRITAVQGVPAGTLSARDLGLAYPAIALARIDLPASTATVQAGHITDLRQLVAPASRTDVLPRVIPAGQSVAFNKLETDLSPLHALLNWDVQVPAWATHCHVTAVYSQGTVAAGRALGRIGISAFGIQYRPGVDQSQYYDITSSANGSRFTVETVGEFEVPKAARGKTAAFVTNQRTAGGSYKDFVLDDFSSARIEITWQQRTS